MISSMTFFFFPPRKQMPARLSVLELTKILFSLMENDSVQFVLSLHLSFDGPGALRIMHLH